MKVWAVMIEWDYEGASHPIGLFTTKDRADDIADKYKGHGDEISVVEYTIDEDTYAEEYD